MKQICLVFMVIVFWFGSIFAQGFQDPYRYPEESSIVGGIGMTWIDNRPYTTFTVAPEISLGKFGMGLYLQFLMDNQNKFTLRKDEYQDGAGILRAIRYIRYGQKYDPFYARIGTLEMAMLGNGFLMWNYNNISNYDKRKIGLALGIDLDKIGFETVTNNLNRFQLIGANLYVRPLRLMNKRIPVLDRFRLYGTFVHDQDLISPEDPDERKSLNAFGLGADLLFLDLPLLKSGIYYDYGKFIDYGSGQAVGINALIPEFIGAFGIGAKFEKRFLNDQFVPNFFGPLYELDRELNRYSNVPAWEDASLYELDRELNPFIALEFAEKNEGYFGQLAGYLLHKVRLIGSYQRLNGVKGSGIVHLEALAPDLVPRFELKAYYDKVGIETFEDFRTLDSRSLATFEVGYRLNMFLLLSTVYRWYWVETEEGIFKPVERVETRISFSVRF